MPCSRLDRLVLFWAKRPDIRLERLALSCSVGTFFMYYWISFFDATRPWSLLARLNEAALSLFVRWYEKLLVGSYEKLRARPTTRRPLTLRILSWLRFHDVRIFPVKRFLVDFSRKLGNFWNDCSQTWNYVPFPAQVFNFKIRKILPAIPTRKTIDPIRYFPFNVSPKSDF